MEKFITQTGKDNQHYFNLLATNGQVILSSEGYTSASGMNNGIESVKKYPGTCMIKINFQLINFEDF